MSDKYESLKLGNQLCFPLYATAKSVVARYTPLLKALDLTYTQYIAMMVMWEHRSLKVRELGSYLHLDSGTLTPLLKKLEAKGFVTRERDTHDERSVIISITDAGMDLRDEALSIPLEMSKCVNLSLDEAVELRRLLDKVLNGNENAEVE